MGFLYVNKSYKGIIVHNFDTSQILDNIPDDWMPTQDWIDGHFHDADVTSDYSNQSKLVKLVLLACLQNIPYYFYSHMPTYRYRSPSISEITSDDIDNIWRDPVYRDDVLRSALALIFCFVYGYPVGSFAWLSDYFCTQMFVCNVQFPPAEFDQKLSQMTETIMANEVSKFLTTITGSTYEAQLQLCKEYAKE